MSTKKLESSVKTRVTPATKETLEKLAAERHLDVSDIVREALREYVGKAVEVDSQPEKEAV